MGGREDLEGHGEAQDRGGPSPSLGTSLRHHTRASLAALSPQGRECGQPRQSCPDAYTASTQPFQLCHRRLIQRCGEKRGTGHDSLKVSRGVSRPAAEPSGSIGSMCSSDAARARAGTSRRETIRQHAAGGTGARPKKVAALQEAEPHDQPGPCPTASSRLLLSSRASLAELTVAIRADSPGNATAARCCPIGDAEGAHRPSTVPHRRPWQGVSGGSVLPSRKSLFSLSPDSRFWEHRGQGWLGQDSGTT